MAQVQVHDPKNPDVPLLIETQLPSNSRVVDPVSQSIWNVYATPVDETATEFNYTVHHFTCQNHPTEWSGMMQIGVESALDIIGFLFVNDIVDSPRSVAQAEQLARNWLNLSCDCCERIRIEDEDDHS